MNNASGRPPSFSRKTLIWLFLTVTVVGLLGGLLSQPLHPAPRGSLVCQGGEEAGRCPKGCFPEATGVSPWGGVHRSALWSLVIGLLMITALSAWLTRRITQPLRRLTQIALAYAHGDLTQQAPAASVREVRELAGALNTMAQAIRRQLDELTSERNQVTAIMGSMAEGVIAVDAQERVVLMNPAAALLLGVTAHEVIGQPLFELIRQHDIQELLHGVMQDRQRRTVTVTLFHPAERMIRVHGVPCQERGSTGPCAVLVIQDITEHTRYEELRKEFVANVSHELKSPLTSIRSLTETLLGGALDDLSHNRRFVQLIDDDATRLTRLIDDLLALSRLESQAVPLTRSTVPLHALVESVVDSLRRAIDERHLTVANRLPQGLSIHGDSDWLRQVFLNLIGNAIKYNREGGEIAVSSVSDASWLTVTVADTGVGIAAEHLPRVFERFYRVDKARSRDLGGTGLGLSIVKHVIEAHGGTVSVTSQVNQGSAFSFTLPLHA
ncbi:MAG: PAS domain-containing protein [Candidatus Omnitrophica bacterium]|nr:PAS domain-containing protein [Candidatus Omnitrophota bacterium]